MVIYNYKVRNITGELITGTIDAANEDAAIYELKQKNYFILDISPPSAFSKEISIGGSQLSFLNKRCV